MSQRCQEPEEINLSEGKGISWNSSRQGGEWTHNDKVLMVEATQAKRLTEAGLDCGLR